MGLERPAMMRAIRRSALDGRWAATKSGIWMASLSRVPDEERERELPPAWDEEPE